MQSGSLDGGVGGEYNGVDLVQASEIFVTQDEFFLCTGTNWLFGHVNFIPDNADKLN